MYERITRGQNKCELDESINKIIMQTMDNEDDDDNDKSCVGLQLVA